MIPSQSALRAYDVSHLIEHAAYWRELATRRRDVVGAITAQADALDWQGQADEAMRAAMAGHLRDAERQAGQLDAAAQRAENGASVLHQQQQAILSGIEQARQQGFAVGEDWSVTDAMYAPGSIAWYARQPTAQAIATQLRTQAGGFATREYQTATDIITAAGDFGGEGTIHRHIQAIDNHFKTDGPPPAPPPPNPPQTGEPIKRQLVHTPPQVITMPDAPSSHTQKPPGFPGCSGEEQFKDFLEILGGLATIGLSVPGETVTGGAATIGIISGGGMVTNGMVGLDQCSK
ncbi:hypothetical protein MSM1_07875 [Mycobacterium sp. SM1]|uniref:hypothetical protein n=1 Tax=Mycobacterium sp. SM1 TaxID=2816243 RepID=UPI001BCC7743|nr:hypothetical protein [Mycobacterium sp. SM1]MBS4728264.1 hypothetical protein [Mycobacterium sp. SM1]